MATPQMSDKFMLALLILIKLTSVASDLSQPIEASRRLATRQSQQQAEKDFPPRLTHQPHSLRAKLHEPQAIECPVEAQPESDVKWFKDGQVLASEPAHLEQTGSELMFFQLNQEDSGEYHCEAQNYLGRVASERFRLAVQSTSDESILLEPQVHTVADQQDLPVEFRCTIPATVLSRAGKVITRHRTSPSQPEQLVRWLRNGRPLSVLWDSSAQQQQQQRSFKARQDDRKPNEFILSVSLPNRQSDDNSTFACRLNDELVEPNELQESRPALLRFEPRRVNKLDISMGPPLDGLSVSPTIPIGSDNTNYQHNNNSTLGDTVAPPAGTDINTPATGAHDIKTTLRETLSDLYQIAKPTLILFAIMCLVAVIVLLQFLFVRRRAQAHRYMKHGVHHHQSHHHRHAGLHHQCSSSGSSSANSSGGAGSGLACLGGTSCEGSGAGDMCDPVLSSLLARTLSAPSASSLSGATKKYKKYYRDAVRSKVAAAGITNEHQLVLDGPQHDFIDAAAYFAAATHHQHQQDACPALFADGNGQSAVPNLYNQSLAAREQARSLLQASEHVRSMGNLAASSQVQRMELPVSKQHSMIMASNAQRSANNNSHQFELPMNFAHHKNNQYNILTGPLESGASSLMHQPSAWMSGANQQQWNQETQRHHLLLAPASYQQTHQRQQQQQKKTLSANEQYQLVSCSSVSPSSTSSVVAGSNSSSTNGACTSRFSGDPSGQETTAMHANSSAPRDSVSNHYSIIENNDDDDDDGERLGPRASCVDDDQRYEQLETGSTEFVRSSARSSAASRSSSSGLAQTAADRSRRFGRKSTFASEQTQGGADSHAPSCEVPPSESAASTNQQAGWTSSVDQSSSSSFRFKRALASASGQQQRRTATTTNKAKQTSSDQLSPYAVSSICHNKQQPPPVSSEAMQALKEQFDINQLVLVDNNSSNQQATSQQQFQGTAPRLPFSLPPPPPPESDCEPSRR